MANPLLNIVLIAKNNTSLSFLRVLNSILKQVYQPIHVLVVDANEPNSLYSLGLQEDLAGFPTVEYLQLDPSLSLPGIRNYTLQYVGGEYVAYLSSNDSWDPTKALLQIEQLEAAPDAAASCSNGTLIDVRKAVVEVDLLIEHLNFDTSKWIIDNPAKMSAQVIYKTAALREAGIFDEYFHNFCDGDMLLRLVKTKKVLLQPIPLCECYLPPDDDSYDLITLKDQQQILYKYMEHFVQNKRMARAYYARMIYLAKINYLWLHCLIYITMYFIKGPVHSISLFFTNFAKITRYLVKWLHKELSLYHKGFQMARNVRRLQKGKSLKKIKSSTENEADAAPVIFPSAHLYNEKRPLDFVFDHKLKGIVIPEYVTIIKKGMFYGCDQLVSVEIPATVLEISPHAFHGCQNLRQVEIREGSRLGTIGAYAFAGCTSLENLILPSSVIRIGKGAFQECISLRQVLFTYRDNNEEQTSVIFPPTINRLTPFLFAGCVNLLSVEFGDSSVLESVGHGAFLGCAMLKKIVLTGNITNLGNYAFSYCRKLETIAIPQIDMIKTIGKCAFMYCESLDYFQMPNQIDRINIGTFLGCSGLKQVKIPKKVLTINHQAFARCTLLTKVMILTNQITISPSAFEKHTQVEFIENGDTIQ